MSSTGEFNFPKQTPLYFAANRNRYYRQEWIKDIEKLTGRRIIVYVSNFHHSNSSISRDDVLPFSELIHDLEDDSEVDFLLHTPGGDPNAAEQLVNTLLPKIKHLRVVVPLTAKSAGTMISLFADEIVMGDSSELGPIDPQVPIRNMQGIMTYRPAKAFLKGLEAIQAEVIKNNGNLNPTYFPILQSVDAAFIQFCRQAEDHARNIAERWLLRSMCIGDAQKARDIADQLLDIEKYPNHGSVINWSEAESLGLKVRYYQINDTVWEAYWRLMSIYLTDMQTQGLAKVFEGSKNSVSV
ncbi:hypothetical protein NDK47_23960 [Brevibacillus ruminantium]|uniref:Serine protease n=1 Tax=Brevibacillus ruminantium TaxID=2950604 RepID=A0ABY4WKG4_9BACL|nr:hypothetical protein [Brevibacillus ruminantium]USG65141.1 hypothetical protein NDK47_23960 [Brevibacillus ruminantium]